MYKHMPAYFVQRSVPARYCGGLLRLEYFMEMSDHAEYFTAKVVQPKVIATELVQPNGFRPLPENEQ